MARLILEYKSYDSQLNDYKTILKKHGYSEDEGDVSYEPGVYFKKGTHKVQLSNDPDIMGHTTHKVVAWTHYPTDEKGQTKGDQGAHGYGSSHKSLDSHLTKFHRSK